MLLPRQLQSHKVRDRLISDHLELSHFIPSFASCSMAVSHSRLERHQVGTGTTLGTAAGAQPFCACFPLPKQLQLLLLPKPFRQAEQLELQTVVISSGGFVGLAHKLLATITW